MHMGARSPYPLYRLWFKKHAFENTVKEEKFHAGIEHILPILTGIL